VPPGHDSHGLSGALTHWRLGNVVTDILPGLIIGILLGAYLGGSLAHLLTEANLRLVFASIIILIALMTSAAPCASASDATIHRWLTKVSLVKLISSSSPNHLRKGLPDRDFAVLPDRCFRYCRGLGASFSGRGGGFLMVPLLMFMGYSAQKAVGTSFMAILVISISALVAHGRLAHVDYKTGLFLGIAALPGPRSAPVSSITFPPAALRRSLRVSWYAWLHTSFPK